MQVDNNSFYENLSETCKTNNLIRPDGKSFSIVDYILNILDSLIGVETISSKNFKQVCKKLSKEGFGDLDPKEKQAIWSRITELQKERFPNIEDKLIKTIESKLNISKDDVYDIWSNISGNLYEADKTQNLEQLKFALKNWTALVDYASQSTNQAIKGEVKNRWWQLCRQLIESSTLIHSSSHGLNLARSLNNNYPKEFRVEDSELQEWEGVPKLIRSVRVRDEIIEENSDGENSNTSYSINSSDHSEHSRASWPKINRKIGENTPFFPDKG